MKAVNATATTVPQICHVRGRRRTTANRAATASPHQHETHGEADRLVAKPRTEHLVRESVPMLPEEALVRRQRKRDRRRNQRELRPVESRLEEPGSRDALRQVAHRAEIRVGSNTRQAATPARKSHRVSQ